MPDEVYRVAFRKKLYHSLAELQADLDQWLRQDNEVRTHQGRWCYGKTPMQTFLDSLPVAREKLIDQHSHAIAAAC
jgi:hypothetical protein